MPRCANGSRSTPRRLVEQRYDWQQIGRSFVDLVEAAAGERSARNGMMIDSPRLRNLFADRNVRTWLVVAMVLLAAVVLGSRASIRWLVLPCAGLAIVVLARHPILGLVAIIATALLIPTRIRHRPGSQPESRPLCWCQPRLRYGSSSWCDAVDIHLPRSRTTTPLLLFILASLLSLVVGNAYWDPAVPRPNNLLLIQLGQWGIFAFSALAFWLTGSLVRDEIWLRRLTFFYLSIAGFLATHSRAARMDTPLWIADRYICLGPCTILAFVGRTGRWAVVLQSETLYLAGRWFLRATWQLSGIAAVFQQSARRCPTWPALRRGLGCPGVVTLATLALGLYRSGASRFG